MQKICKCLTDCASNLTDFMRGKIDARKLKNRLFGSLNPDNMASKPRLRCGKRKQKSKWSPECRSGIQKRTKCAMQDEEPSRQADAAPGNAPAPVVTAPVPQQHLGCQTRCGQSVEMPPWPLVIVPSGFGYGLPVRLPGPGLLGRAPGYLTGFQLPKQGPLLRTPCREDKMCRPQLSITADQLQHDEEKKIVPPDSGR
jgi:hypothetical protein